MYFAYDSSKQISRNEHVSCITNAEIRTTNGDTVVHGVHTAVHGG